MCMFLFIEYSTMSLRLEWLDMQRCNYCNLIINYLVTNFINKIFKIILKQKQAKNQQKIFFQKQQIYHFWYFFHINIVFMSTFIPIHISCAWYKNEKNIYLMWPSQWPTWCWQWPIPAPSLKTFGLLHPDWGRKFCGHRTFEKEKYGSRTKKVKTFLVRML